MPIQIVRNDITKMHVDAIVNAANNKLMPGGGVCGAIHKAAGPQLAAECSLLGGCDTGAVKATFGYDLPAKYVIHTVGPVWHGGEYGEREALSSCYKESLALAKEKGCETIAFPLISSGIFGYPKKEALRVAMDAISSFLMDNEMMVYLAVFDKDALSVSKALFANIEEYIDEHYVDEAKLLDSYRRRMQEEELNCFEKGAYAPAASIGAAYQSDTAPSDGDLDDWLDAIDESFSEMVLRKIEEKGMTNAECYKKANIDKKHFSKIKSNTNYKPKKNNALALAIALELSLDETKELLMKAGLALSHSNRFDIIVEYFIVHKQYDIYEINEALFNYDQPLLGGAIE
ncbi:MAG: macro domain-containing protein [Bacillota bacterium]|nr:macro domain-containing protein [Bacillota bacterium]